MKLRRFMSLAISVAMLISMVPALSASASQEHTLKYEFRSDAITDSPTTVQLAAGKASISGAGFTTLRYAKANSTALSDKIKYVTASANKGAMLFAIEVDEPGTYVPSVEYFVAARGSFMKAYIIKDASVLTNGSDASGEDTALMADLVALAPLDSTYIDTYASADDLTNGKVHIYTETVTFDKAGTYYLALAADGARTEANTKAGKTMLYVSNFSLTKQAEQGGGSDEESDPVDYVYSITSAAANLASGTSIENATNTATVNTAPWKFVQGYKLSSRSLYENGYRMNDHASYGYNGTLLEIEVGKNATFVPSVSYSKHLQAGSFKVYLFDTKKAEELGLSLEFNANNGTDIKKILDNVTPIDNASIEGYSETATSEWAESGTHTYNRMTLEKGTYYLMFSVNDVSGEQKRAYIKNFRLKEYAEPDKFEKVEIVVEGIANEDDAMPRATEKQLSFKMIDSKGKVIEEADETKIEVEYSSSDKKVASISESGLVTALKNGETKLTAKVTYNGETVEGEYNLVVADCGANLMADYNPDFESDLWIWKNQREDSAPAEAKFMRVMLGTKATDEDADNRAMGIVFDPSVAAGSNPPVIELSTSLDGGKRVKVDPGKFYEVSFKIKVEDFVTPENAKDMTLVLSVFGYTHPAKGESLAIFKRMQDISLEENFREKYGDWVEFSVPVAAPTEYEGEVYLTPRITIRPQNDKDLATAGYSGTVWLDDFAICEVGYDGLKLEVKDAENAVKNSAVTIVATPYATTGTAMSVGTGWMTKHTKFESSDSYIIKNFNDIKLEEGYNGCSSVVTEAVLGGKNGNVAVSALTELNGITREATLDITIDGFEYKLLYAEIVPSKTENILIGQTVELTTKGYMSDGSVADMAEGTIVYTSETPEILSVDENGVVSALADGIGTIKATLTLNGAVVNEYVDIEVADKTPIVSAQIDAEATVGYLRDAQIILSGKRESGLDANFKNATVKWVVSSDPVGGISVDENGLVFGHTFGAVAEIYADIIQEGRENIKTNTVTVTVAESDLRDLTINFGEPTCAPAEVTIDEYGWAVNTKKSHSSAIDGTITIGNGFYSKTKSGILAIDVYVPYEGAYQPIFYSVYSGSNARTADVFVDEIYIGEHDYGAAGMKMSKLRTVYLTAGTHTFYFDALTAGKNLKYYHTLYKLHLAARSDVAGIDRIETSADSYNIAIGMEKNLDAKVLFDDATYYTGRTMYSGAKDPMASMTFESSDESVVKVTSAGVIKAMGNGEAVVTITAKTSSETKVKEISITVSEGGESNSLAAVEITAKSFVMSLDAAGIQLNAAGKTSIGNSVALNNAEITWRSCDESVVAVDDNGFATPVSIGTAEVELSVVCDGVEKTAKAFISVREGKTGRSFYTEEKLEAARENITKYSWAKQTKDAAVKRAERYLGLEETLWNIVPGQDLPRSNSVGYKNDPDMHYCRYCGSYLYEKFGRYGYSANPLTRPWKIQCQECKRLFPSNDFESFYELGINENGVFSRELALERNAELVANGEDGYLVNVLYPELYDPSKASYNKDPRTGDEVDGRYWGVDDGMGYDTGRVYESSEVAEVHTYIAYYHHVALWYSNGASAPIIYDALESLSDAYIYTGDSKYGRVGAILLDRIADLYPDYSIIPYLTASNNKGISGIFYVSSGGNTAGKTVGSIWENFVADKLALAYDAFFPAYDDPYVVSFLSKKAEKYQMENDKSTPEKIRQNCEDGILREIFKGAEEAQIKGNFGFVQATVATTAVVLDTHPETQEMIDWIFAQSKTDGETYNTGGGVNTQLISFVSRDGQGNESAPGYNKIWITDLSDAASKLAGYDGYEGINLYEHPKYMRMIKSYPELTIVRRGVPPIGDSSMAANYSKLPNDDNVMINAFAETGDIEIAQHFYKMSDADFSTIHYDIFTKNPESLRSDIEAIIQKYGEYNYDKSSMLTGYGFGALRAGTLHNSTGVDVVRDTERDIWMYFGGAVSHSNFDKLSIGIESYGIPFTTDLGYPEATGNNPNKHQWANTTLAHNAVVINEKNQMQFDFNQNPLHFDATDSRVKVMDVDATPVYIEADEYRRTVVMVDYDDEVSYGIDFFKVSGGDDHIYSFHANSETDPETSDNLNFVYQEGGTYAGADVPFGNDPWTNESDADAELKYPRGYTWLYDIAKAEKPGENEFWFDFKIKDFRGLSRNGTQNLRLRMTVLNDFDADEVTLANAKPPRTANNMQYIDHLEYMLIRRKGEKLSSLFTTVIEPYNGNRYISNIENVAVTVDDASEVRPGDKDAVKAVKVEFVNGRCDYIVYAQNNNVTYNVADVFKFRGFVGVWSVNAEGKNIYSYINHGEMIGNDEKLVDNLTSEITGKIVDFQKDLSFDNWIDVELDSEITEEQAFAMADRLMSIENPTKLGNSAFVIKSAKLKTPTTVRLDLGEVTLIDGFKNPDEESLGYSYDAEIGRKISVPMSYEEAKYPVFDDVSDNISTSAGNSISVSVSAKADEGSVKYSARTLPRGASFDEEKATVTWKPNGGQLGDSLFAIDATDEYGRTSTLYFTIKVYGSTSGSGGGAGGGGGGASEPSTPSVSDKEDTTDKTDDKEDVTPSTPSTPSVDSDARFVDLGAHAWAEDAINALAEDGIIKGTSENTFSPAANITRADFAILLVRAFKLESNSEENFADVLASDYFAKELAIARNTGIVGGIGDNKYAPKNNITRQDMMVIVYRALTKLGIELEVKDVEYADFADVADYAEDAVSALITAGLVNGKNGKIAPTDYTTRAEVAVLIKRILDYIAK